MLKYKNDSVGGKRMGSIIIFLKNANEIYEVYST